MKKILATIIKEWILLRRDIGGLMMLLIMPGILIMVMAMVQDLKILTRNNILPAIISFILLRPIPAAARILFYGM